MKNVNNGFMQAARFCARESMCSPPRVEPRAPHRFAGVDVAQARHARLVEQEKLQRPPARVQQSGETLRGEIGGDGIDAERSDSRQAFRRVEPLHSAEVAPVNEAEPSFVQLQKNVNVAGESARIKPDWLAIQPKVKYQPSALQAQQKILPATFHALNPLPAGLPREFGGGLRFAAPGRRPDRDGMNNPAAANGAARQEGP